MVAKPESIKEWLEKEVAYMPPGQHITSSGKLSTPSTESLGKICRGNMVPIWNFLIKRVKSDKNVENIKKNILVHGGFGIMDGWSGSVDKGTLGDRGAALRERQIAYSELGRLRTVVKRLKKDLKVKMIEISKEESERKSMLEEFQKNRHKQATLQAFDQQCNEAVKILAEYHNRLERCVIEARDRRNLSSRTQSEANVVFNKANFKDAYFSSKNTSLTDNHILDESVLEKCIEKACKYLAHHTLEKIRNSFPAYDGNGLHMNLHMEVERLQFDFDGELIDEVRTLIVNSLGNPPKLLKAVTSYTSQLRAVISKEIEDANAKANTEMLRHKLDNSRIIENPWIGNITTVVSSKGPQDRLLERQKAHVQQFLAIEDKHNKAAQAKIMCEKLMKNFLHRRDLTPQIYGNGASQDNKNFRQFELDVLAMEREVAGLKASVATLTSEIERLNELCAERKEAKDSLKKKWKKIEEFDSRRSELESVYDALLTANTDAAAFWAQQPLLAREFASSAIIEPCEVLEDTAVSARDLIEKEINAFSQCPENNTLMLPSTAQGLVEYTGSTGPTGADAIAMAERNAASLLARAGSGDPSAIPSISRLSAALQSPHSLECTDASLVSVVDSLKFCLKLCGSEANVLEELVKTMNLVNMHKQLVENGHALLHHASVSRQDHESIAKHCLDVASKHDEIVREKWLPEIRAAYLNAEKCLQKCKNVKILMDEWWDQPASTIVDWITVDGRNVMAWTNHVKQLLTFYDKQHL